MLMSTRTHVARASLVLALVFTLSTTSPWAPVPPQVRAMCGEPPIAEESLCNVEEGLHDAYLLLEHIASDGQDDVPGRVSAVVRDRLVSVEWYPNADPTSVRAGLMGMYNEGTHRILLPQGLRGEPLRVRSSVMAHELGHAALLYDEVAAGLRPAETCLEHEARAYKVGIIVYERARHLIDEPGGAEGSVDRHLADELDLWWRFSGGETFTPSGLDDLANRHIFLHGYAIDCNWR
jgi:hypothetical protein